MTMVDLPFVDTFTFTRGRTAPYLNAAGDMVLAPIDQPRFDHSSDGEPRGLLIEGRPEFDQADRLRILDGAWNVAGGTVLHHWQDDAGVEWRRAVYAPSDPMGTVNGCLNLKGHIREIAYVPTYLPNRGGYVMWRRRAWELGGVLGVQPNVALGVTANIMMLEG